jgi:hypothetical protein
MSIENIISYISVWFGNNNIRKFDSVLSLVNAIVMIRRGYEETSKPPSSEKRLDLKA